MASEDQRGRAEALRGLPSVEALASSLERPHALAVIAARIEVEATRAAIVAGEAGVVDREALRGAALDRVDAMLAGSLRPVVNATGVVLHTNLGRAPLAPEAAAAAAAIASGYSNLELDLASGARGSRHEHLEELIRGLTGAEAAIAVNNNAAAVLLALSATAASREVVIGRDQLIEIGGSFRIPEILELSGATLVEVGTTNRTRIGDYAAAIGAGTGALMRVHQSNFRTIGFSEGVALEELVALGRERGVPVIDDLGSGALAPFGDEPLLSSSLSGGADLVCCSADKLLGGPQAGIVAGTASAVERCRSHPLARAVRLDKLQLAALEATLRIHLESAAERIPAVAMLAADPAALERRASRMAATIGAAARVGSGGSLAGGGTLPLLEIEGPVCMIDAGSGGPDRLLATLREGDPPVIARIAGGDVLLDPRTMSDEEAELSAERTRDALR